MQLRPSEQFPITRQIDDPLDTDTYYIRAYVRNARSDTLLKTLNLTDNGDQRFSVNYDVPVDESGQGFYVTITTKVFTDSGYSSESDIYGREKKQYLIQDRRNPYAGGFGGGGSDINYRKLRQIIREEILGIKFPDIPEAKDVDLSPLIENGETLSEALSKIIIGIGNIHIPEPEKFDYDQINNGRSESEKNIMQSINDIPQTPEADFKPTLTKMDKMESNQKNITKLISHIMKELSKDKSNYNKFIQKEVKSKLEWLNNAVDLEDKREAPPPKKKRKLF